MKTSPHRIRNFSGALVLALALGACTTQTDTKPSAVPTPQPKSDAPTPEQIQEGKETLKKSADVSRESWKKRSFKEFEAKVYREPFAGGKYIVNGDTPIRDKKQLREFYEQLTAVPEPQAGTGPVMLIVGTADGLDKVWNSGDKRKLNYCVSKQFGANYDAVVNAMAAATGAWETVADVNFDHVLGEDDNCTASNANVKFDVRPVNVNGQYLARAFFPNDPRSASNVLIDDTSFALAPNQKLTLTGILRHELGHTIGFRHEHTRPDSGKCFEDQNWRPLTNYDAFSVMHYPQCNGMGDWSLVLTDRDKSGSACLYGAAPGFVIDTTICSPSTPVPNPGGQEKTETFKKQHVNRNQARPYGPFEVAAGTLLTLKMSGIAPAGDPDLYVRFGAAPDRSAKRFSCRPYLSGAEETCSLDVPAGESQAFVMVHGYNAGNYNLAATYTPPN